MPTPPHRDQIARLPDQETDFLQLEVETPQGVFVRTIRPAAFLPDGVDRGWAAETATRGAAAFWGLRDFVFRPALQHRGAASRELGDTIIVVGPRAASVQVKSRHGPSNDERRERTWLDKKIAEGVRQSVGTIRAVHRAGVVELENERGMAIPIRAADKMWIPVVIVDHPGLESYVPTSTAVVLLRRDWEFLFEQLKSTYAVLEYLARVHGRPGAVDLGHEAIRYYAPMGRLGLGHAPLRGRTRSGRLLAVKRTAAQLRPARPSAQRRCGRVALATLSAGDQRRLVAHMPGTPSTEGANGESAEPQPLRCQTG